MDEIQRGGMSGYLPRQITCCGRRHLIGHFDHNEVAVIIAFLIATGATNTTSYLGIGAPSAYV